MSIITKNYFIFGLKIRSLFLLLVVIPILMTTVYYMLFASDVFVSETRFVVRQPEKKNLSSLGVFLQSAGITSARDEAFTVLDFILSRDALQLVDQKYDLRKRYSNGSIFQRFNPFKADDSTESLFNYYKSRIKVETNTATSITTVSVKAFTPEDAYLINSELLLLSEGLINRLNARAQQDIIKFSMQEKQLAETEAKAAAVALTNYRDRQTLFDPNQQSTIQLQQVSKLQSELINVRGQQAQLNAFAADSPLAKSFEKRISELQKEIKAEMLKITGGDHSLTQKLSEYERLSLDRDFSNKRLAAAMASLDQARNEAQRQQLYLELIVQPHKPDVATLPERGRGILTIAIGSLLFYGILRLLLVGIMEHTS